MLIVKRSPIITALLTTFALTAESGVQTAQEHLLVSAIRQPLPAASQALAFSRINSDTLNFTGATHINELLQQAAGVWISRGNGQEHLTALRSPVLTGAGGCGAFFMAADGISLRAPGFCNINQLFEVDATAAGALEIIKGPGTALYGSNALHGIINVLSQAPTPIPQYRLTLTTGPHQYRRGQLTYSTTKGRHGVSLSSSGTTDAGFKTNSGFDQQQALLRYDYTSKYWQVNSVLALSNLNQETAAYIKGYKAFKNRELKKHNPSPEAFRDASTLRAHSQITTTLSNNHRLTLTPYIRNNDMRFLQHYLPWQPIEENGHTSVGLNTALYSQFTTGRLISGIDLDLTYGYLKETQKQPFSPSKPQGTHYDYQVNAFTGAVFAQWQQTISSQWLFNTGARLEYNRYDYDNRTQDGAACAPNIKDCRFYRRADRSDHFSNLSANIGLSRLWFDRHYTYARIAQGFRAPQATELYRLQSGQQQAELDSEAITSIDIGWRGEFAEGLRYDIGLWFANKRNVIFQDTDRHTISGAKTRHNGLDLSLYLPFKNDFYIHTEATWADHRYGNNVRLLGAKSNIKNNIIDTAPQHFGSARLGWKNSRQKLELEWIYMGSYYLGPDNLSRYNGHSLLNLRISTALTNKLQLSVRLLNLGNRDYAERADFGFSTYRYFVGEERAAYVALTWRSDSITP